MENEVAEVRNLKKYPREPRLRLRFLPEEVGNNPSYRGGDWQRQRGLALARARGLCEGCGISSAEGARLSVHHIMGYAYGGSNELSNLKVLCTMCHPALESYGGRGEGEVG